MWCCCCFSVALTHCDLLDSDPHRLLLIWWTFEMFFINAWWARVNILPLRNCVGIVFFSYSCAIPWNRLVPPFKRFLVRKFTMPATHNPLKTTNYAQWMQKKVSAYFCGNNLIFINWNGWMHGMQCRTHYAHRYPHDVAVWLTQVQRTVI